MVTAMSGFGVLVALIAVSWLPVRAQTDAVAPVPSVFADGNSDPCPQCSCDVGVSALTGVGTALSAGATAWVPLGPVWPGSKPRVPVYVSTNLEGHIPYDGTFEQGVQAIINAMNEWNDWQRAYLHGGSEFEFYYAGTTDISVIADDGVNVIMFSNTQCPFGSGCVGYCQWSSSNGSTRGFDAVLYDRSGTTGYQLNWAVRTSPLPSESDVWSVVLHELGHGFGLAHSSYGGVVMSPSGCFTGCSRRRLYNDDIDGILGLYGPATTDGLWASTSSVAPGDTFTVELDYPGAAGKRYELRYGTDATGGFGPPGDGPLNPAPRGFAFREWLCLQGPHWRPCDDRDSRIFPLANLGLKGWEEPGVFTAAAGVLDTSGRATVTVHLPADALTRFGPTLYLAAMTRDDTSSAEITSPTQVLDVSVGVRVSIVPCAPTVDTQPGAATACRGGSAGFTVGVTGTGPFTYQWRRGGVNIADGATGTGSIIVGAATAQLQVQNASAADAAAYDCMITNICGSATSDEAALTICPTDFNCDGFVSGDDFDGYVAAFEAGDPAADFNQDGFTTGDDFDLFVAAFETGC